MDYKEIKASADRLMDDEAIVMARILSLREPKPLDPFAERAKGGRPFCPKCGAAMWMNGTSEGRQKWLCGGCGATLRSCSGGPAESARKKAVVWLRFIECELARKSLRAAAAECGISLPDAFYLRHKMQAALSERLGKAELFGRVEMDGKVFRINLKGTKPDGMPRKSKRRGSGSKAMGHKVMTIWAIDECDNMVAKIVGLGAEDRRKADVMLPHLKGCKTLVTDDRSCYESFAKDNGFAHIQIKSAAHPSESGETMNEVNSLMSDFETWSARYRGISTRHLQGYLDRFLLQKMLGYAKEAMDGPGAQLDAIMSERVVIACREVLEKAMPIDLFEAYGEWGYGIFKKNG